MKSVFISRDLPTDSVFVKTLTENGYLVYGQSLLSFSAVPFQTVPTCDWIFFYSKKGVDFFFRQLLEPRGSFPKVNYAAIGKATAQQIRHYGLDVAFTGDGDPSATSALFLKVAAQQTVLFPQAQHSRRSVQRLLGDDIDGKTLIVYNNQSKIHHHLPEVDCLVFTSPMNVQAYRKHKPIEASQKVIAIGKTTQKTLLDLAIKAPIFLAKEPSEKALAQAVITAYHS